MTKTEFLTTYREVLKKTYSWAQDAAKLEKFMDSCAKTICTEAVTWNHDGEAVVAAWKAIGGKGKPSLKALRGLEE